MANSNKVPTSLTPNNDYSKVSGTYDDQLTVNKLAAERAYAKAVEAGLRKVVSTDGKVILVDDAHCVAAVASGNYVPAENEEMNVLDAEGNTYQFSNVNSFREALIGGKYRLETLAEAKQRKLEYIEYNSVPSQILRAIDDNKFLIGTSFLFVFLTLVFFLKRNLLVQILKPYKKIVLGLISENMKKIAAITFGIIFLIILYNRFVSQKENAYSENEFDNKRIIYCIDKKVTEGWASSAAEVHCQKTVGY